jgi:hypothetical protein
VVQNIDRNPLNPGILQELQLHAAPIAILRQY